MMLGARTPDDAMAGMEWLYGEPKELTQNTSPRAAGRGS